MIFLGVAMVVVPLLGLWVNKRWFQNTMGLGFISFASAFGVYVLLLLNVLYVDYRLEQELDAFDLNRDGFFSGAEITPEQTKAMTRVVNDTARSLAPFTGAVFALIYGVLVWLLLVVWKVWRRK